MEQQEPLLTEQKRTTAARAAVVAIVVAAVVALVVAIVVLRGGGGIGSIPVYAGAVENAEVSAQARADLENWGISGVDAKVYYSTQDGGTIAEYYKSEMVWMGWTKENEVTQHGDACLAFKRGNDGAMIVIDNATRKGTELSLLYGPFGSIQQVWNYVAQYYSASAGPSYPAVAVTAQTDAATSDNIQLVVSSGGPIPAGDWSYRLTQTQGSGTWVTPTYALAMGTTNLENKASTPGTWYVSLKHVPSGHLYIEDVFVAVS